MTEPPFKISIVPVTPFQQNCSIVVCSKTNKAAIVDPGGDVDVIINAVKKMGATPEKILITHGHLDHVGGVAELAEKLSLPVEGPHQDDAPLLANVQNQAARFGVSGLKNATTGRWLKDGDSVTVGDVQFDVRHVPGHAPGHVVFIQHQAKIAIVGDTLFQGSIGRTDLPGGNHAQLIRAIKEKLMTLSDDMVILPGHGNPSTIGDERATNPYLNEG